MVFFQFAEQRTLGVLFSSFLLAALASCAGDRESTQRYQVDVLGQPVPVGAPTEFTVKLADASTGRPVQGAKITSARVEMTHPHFAHEGSGAGAMKTTMGRGDAQFVGSAGPGLYRLMADVSMPGTLKVDLSANIPGKRQLIQETVELEARCHPLANHRRTTEGAQWRYLQQRGVIVLIPSTAERKLI